MKRIINVIMAVVFLCLLTIFAAMLTKRLTRDPPPWQPDELEQTSDAPVCVYHFAVLVTCETAVGYEPECTVDRKEIIERSLEQAIEQCEMEEQK